MKTLTCFHSYRGKAHPFEEVTDISYAGLVSDDGHTRM
jgi:hypothetical protein